MKPEAPMQVWQLMSTDVVTLDANGTLDIADDLMKLKRVRHLPVIDNGKLAGLITQRDLFLAGVSSVLHFRRTAEKEWLGHIKIAEVMTRDLVTIAPDASVDDAVSRRLEHKIGCLPVVSSGALVGLLSETDLLRYLRRILQIADVKRRIAEEEPPVEVT
jgi:CBS domain-containing membrane protein